MKQHLKKTVSASKYTDAWETSFHGRPKWAWVSTTGVEDMQRDLMGNRLREVPVLGDGNCFFRALQHFTGVDHLLARQHIVDELRNFPEDYRPFLAGQDWNDALDGLAANGAWTNEAADLVVLAAAAVYQRPILLFTPHLGAILTAPIRATDVAIDRTPITLIYTGAHYNIATADNDVPKYLAEPAPDPVNLKPSSRQTALQFNDQSNLPTKRKFSEVEEGLMGKMVAKFGTKFEEMSKEWKRIHSGEAFQGQYYTIVLRDKANLKSKHQSMKRRHDMAQVAMTRSTTARLLGQVPCPVPEPASQPGLPNPGSVQPVSEPVPVVPVHAPAPVQPVPEPVPVVPVPAPATVAQPGPGPAPQLAPPAMTNEVAHLLNLLRQTLPPPTGR